MTSAAPSSTFFFGEQILFHSVLVMSLCLLLSNLTPSSLVIQVPVSDRVSHSMQEYTNVSNVTYLRLQQISPLQKQNDYYFGQSDFV
jgi:hypothetical protein